MEPLGILPGCGKIPHNMSIPAMNSIQLFMKNSLAMPT
jgi:hypothetical protein